MTDRQMITTPALNALSGHGLTDARVIVMSDAELYPERQGQSVTGRAVAYSAFCPATERFSLVTLDGRWIIPGKEGYKTRGPVKSFARKNIEDVRPDELVILEPVRHNGRYAATRYGQRKAGICRGWVRSATRGYGYECPCGAVLNGSDVSRDGFTIVSDGRSGTHVVAYAVRSEHRIEWSANVTMRHDAPVVVATPFRPAAEVIADGQERKAEPAPVADAPAESVPDAPVEPPFVGPYGVRERKISSVVPTLGGVHPSRWDVVDANGRVASADHMSALAASVRADFLNGEHGQGQTPETAPEGTPDNARRLVASGATGRAYVAGNGVRMRIESTDGRCAFALHTVPDDAPDEAKAGFAATAREFADVIRNRAESPAVFKRAKVQMWSSRPAPRKAFEPKDYAPGSMLAWVVEGVRYTGQVWATRVQGGDWNRNHSSYDPGEATAVIVATVDGRRARRDEAVLVPLYTGSRRKTAYAFVSFPMGPMDSDGRVSRWRADVTVIAPECASDGLFDVVTPCVDDVDMWESEGGAFVREYDDAPDAPEPVADAPAESERIVGAHCHSCQKDGLVIAGTCRRCGRVDIVSMMTAGGPRMCPAEEKAHATGRLYCRRCFRTGVALYASRYWTPDGRALRFHICADCYGSRVPSAQPADVKAPAIATIRAARKAREFAERHGCSVGDQFRAAEAARLRTAQEFGARAGDVISDPCGEAAWEGEGGAVPGVATPPPAPESEPSDGDAVADAAETAPEPAAFTELDASISNEGRTPGGEGGISPELDAYASNKTAAPSTRTRYHVGMNEIGFDPIYRVECLGDLDAARVWLIADMANTAEDVEDDSAFDAYLDKLARTSDAELVGEHPLDAFVFWVRAVENCGCPCDCAETGRADECDGEHNREAAAEPAEGRSAPVGAAPDVVSDPGGVDGWESDGGACSGVEPPRGPESGPVGAEGAPAPHTPGGGTAAVPAAVREARRRAEEAEGKAEAAQRRAERLQEASSEHYGRFAGGQPILMGHHSARGAMRDRARGDAATRRAIEAAAEADRLKCAARKARQAADLAEVVHGRSRPWERADFRPGDVVDVRKVYTDKYVVVRANAKTLTLRNVYTVTDTKARYDQVLSRRRDGRTVTDPGQLDAPPASSGGGAVATEEEAPAPGGVGGISPELDACTPKGDVPAFAPNPTGDPGSADTSAGAPWAPAPDGERWDFALVRQALTRRGLTAGDFGGPDGWNIGPDMWDVMVTRVQAGSPYRPRGKARETWDGALRTYAEAVEAAGATVVRRNHHCVVVRVPVPAELRTTARARRVGALDDFTTAITFDGYDGIGGTVSLRSAGAGAATYEVRDHSGHAVDASQTDRRAATASLAHWYGLPTPAEYVEAGRAAEGPALSGELDAHAPSRSVPSSAPDVISDPGAVDTWESDGGACPGVEPPRGPENGPVSAEGAPAPHTPGDGTAAPSPTKEAEDLTGAAGHPALVECRAAAELLNAHADAHPDDETAQGWAFEAVERVDLCTWAVEEGDEEAAAEYARAAKGERAAVTLGQLDEAGPMTPERLATLDADTLALLQWYAGPWPMRWLWPPEEGTPRVINLFHGPGGWSVGIRDVLGADVDMVGVDLDPGAVATATAAGFEVIHASVTDLDPECPALRWVTGIILSPPCQAFSPAGLRMGRYASAIELIVSVVRGVGAAGGFFALVDDEGQDAGSAPRSGESWDDVRAPLAELDDPRAGLMAEVVLWPLAMIARGGSVEWVAVEQSSALPAEIEAALTAELVQAGWGTVEAETLDAVRYGSPSHRRRRFLSAFRTAAPFVSIHPAEDFPVTTFAECAGWARGRTVNTRGQRGIDPKTGRPKGGNAFPADRPSGCITATAYGWKDDESGEKLGQATIGRLVGFPGDYPWTHVGRGAGIRNKAQQAADAVCPMVGAAIIGRALGIEEWEPRARAYADALYRPVARTAAPLAVILPRPRPAEPVTVEATSAAGPTPADPSGVLSGAAAAPAGAPVPRPLSRRMWTRGSGVSAQVTARDRAPRDNPRDRATRQPAGVRAGSRGPPRRGLPAGGSGSRSLPKT